MSITQFINNKNNILIIPAIPGNVDCFHSSIALSHTLRRLGKETSVYFAQSIYLKSIQEMFKKSKITILTKNDLNNIIVTLDNLDVDVDDITWKRQENKLDIIINTHKKNIGSNPIGLKLKKFDFDGIIIVGNENANSVKEIVSNRPELLSPKNTLVISNEKNKEITFPTLKVKSPIVGQEMYELLKEAKIGLDKQISTYLLAGIYWGTNGFRQYVDDRTFFVCNKLLAWGANIEEAKQTLNLVGFDQTRYWAGLFSNVRSAGKGIYYSQVSQQEAKNTTNGLIDSDKVSISKIKNCRVAFSIIKGEEKNTVVIQSNYKEIDISQIIADHKGTGSSANGWFVTDKSAEDIANMLVKIVDTVDASRERIQSKPTMKSQSNMQTDKKNEKTKDISKSIENSKVVKPTIVNQYPQKGEQVQKLDQSEVQKEDTKNAVGDYEIKPTTLNGDPLAPANKIPQPLKVGAQAPTPKPVQSGPLPPVV